MTTEEVLKMFGEGFDCSQVVLQNVSEKIGITKEEALKVAACFGGGMWHGRTCGCVSGALMALGIKYATTKPNDKEQKETENKQTFFNHRLFLILLISIPLLLFPIFL